MSERSNTTASGPQPAGGEQWVGLDVAGAIPKRTGAATALVVSSDGAARRLRLRRSRSQVLSALDTGGSSLQQQARQVFVGSSLLLVPVVAVNLWATSLVFDRTGSTRLTAFGGDDIGTGVEDVAAMLAVVCASLAAAVVGLFASIVLISDRFGESISLRVALGSTVRRLPSVLVTWSVGHFWVPFFVVWVLSARTENTAGRLFLVVLLATFFTSVTLMAVPAMVAERLGPFAALRRSARLFRLRPGTSLGFVCTASLVGTLLYTGIAAVPTLLEATGFITFGGLLGLVQGVSAQLAVIVVVPLIALATASLYLLVRLDAEGLDIVLDAEAAFGDGVAGSAGSGWGGGA